MLIFGGVYTSIRFGEKMAAFKSMLIEWGLGQFLEAFEEEGITDESFELLDDETLNKLFKKSGPRLIFKKKFQERLHQLGLLADNNGGAILFTAETESTCSTDTIPSNYSFTYEPDGELSSALNTTDLEYLTATPAKMPRMVENDIVEFKIISVFPQGLEAVLKKSPDGQIVLANKTKLSNDCRQKLCKIIINELISLFGIELKSSLFVKISQELELFFLNECSETYYIPYVPLMKNSSPLRTLERNAENHGESSVTKSPKAAGSAPKGKLWSRYIYVRSALRVANSHKRKIVDSPTINPDESPQEILSLEFLKVATEPFTKILEAWELTYKVRRRKYINWDLTNIFDEFPCLKLNTGLDLIETDFNQKFPDKVDIIYITWPKVAEAVVKESKERKIKLSDTDEVDPLLYALMTLPFLFTPVTLKKSRKGTLWRPTRSEVLNSFFLHIPSYDELEEIINARRQKLHDYGVTMQPFGAIVGPLTSPGGFFIIVDDKRFRVDSCLRTLELLFKLYHALDIDYPMECEHVWLFISEIVFQMKSPKKNAATASLIADVKYHLN